MTRYKTKKIDNLDIFYRESSLRTKAKVDLVGSLVLLLPVCVLIAWSSYPYIITTWSVFEGSRETSGIHAVFLLKSVIWIFAGLLMLQGISIAARSYLFLAGKTEVLKTNTDTEGHI